MSKPESTGAKSLEEILASIRNSLADEPIDRPPEPRIAPAKAAQPQPQLQPQPKPASPINAAAKSFGLSNKLAGALNGSAPDADLSDLLATETKKPAPAPTPAAPSGGAKPANANGGDDKDPLWFLSRLSGAVSGAAAGPAQQQGAAARARDAAKAPVPAEEVKLSRPETLRPSLPPLFDGNAPPAPANTAPTKDKLADVVSTAARTEPRTTPSHANGVAHTAKETAKAGPEAPTVITTPAPEASPAAAAPTVPAWTKASEPAASEAEPAPVATAETEATDSPDAPAEAPATADALLGGALQTRALEQMIAELLEPVIRQWLQANLPRLIEKAVREEVARVTAAERATKV